MLRSLALSAGLIAHANAFWRMECPGRVGLARLDPIVNPNGISAHAHAIHGSSAFSDSSDSADLEGGSCTSCRVTQDKSAYWHPAIYFEDDASKQVELVPQVGGMLAYYFLRGNDIKAFPRGFKMLSGSNERRDYTLPNPPTELEKSFKGNMGEATQANLAQRAIGFNCLNYSPNKDEDALARHGLPNKDFLDENCPNGLRIEIMFPSCWNGKDLDSPNHKDHVAFPDDVQAGNCPKEFPTRLPGLMYEIIWNTAAFKGRKGRFVISNGDTTGFGYHADFMTGWDPEFLQKAVNTCTSDTGSINDCSVFEVVDHGVATSCNMTKPLPEILKNEDVNGPRVKLPGDIEVGAIMKHAPGPEQSNQPSSNTNSAPQAPKKPDEAVHPAPQEAEKPTNEAQAAAAAAAAAAEEAGKQVGSAPQEAEKPANEAQAAAAAAAAAAPAVQEAGKQAESPPQVPPPVSGEAFKEAHANVVEKVNKVQPIPEGPSPTPAPAPASPASQESYVRTETKTEGNLVKVILWKQKDEVVYEEAPAVNNAAVHLPCQETAAPGLERRASKHRRHAAHHAHAHAKF